ncbi:hypothetical protein, partial [Streptomyces sp. NPDC006999]|uniref:hypothetical protein n=1 Tax=Streptomyces sp. NPDC006999 TaxID=3156909 RepID=UPI0033BFCBD8
WCSTRLPRHRPGTDTGVGSGPLACADAGSVDAWRAGLEVAVAGDLEPRGTGVRMRRVTRFVVRPE